MSDETQVVDKWEVKARELGWKPQDQFEGEEDEFVPAREFVQREGFFSKIRQQKREIEDLKSLVKSTVEYVDKATAAAYRKAMKELSAKRDQAVEAGDTKALHEVENEIKEHTDELRAARSSVKEPTDEPPAEFTEWVSKNKWFTSDSEMQGLASSAFDRYMKDHPKAEIATALDYAEKMVKRGFPEHFEKSKPTSVEGHTQSTSSPRRKGYNDLNQHQKKVCDGFERMGVMSRADYIASLIDMGDL